MDVYDVTQSTCLSDICVALGTTNSSARTPGPHGNKSNQTQSSLIQPSPQGHISRH